MGLPSGEILKFSDLNCHTFFAPVRRFAQN
jgi:hypothetical protein